MDRIPYLPEESGSRIVVALRFFDQVLAEPNRRRLVERLGLLYRSSAPWSRETVTFARHPPGRLDHGPGFESAVEFEGNLSIVGSTIR
jgi:hypothetical protein